MFAVQEIHVPGPSHSLIAFWAIRASTRPCNSKRYLAEPACLLH